MKRTTNKQTNTKVRHDHLRPEAHPCLQLSSPLLGTLNNACGFLIIARGSQFDDQLGIPRIDTESNNSNSVPERRLILILLLFVLVIFLPSLPTLLDFFTTSGSSLCLIRPSRCLLASLSYTRLFCLFVLLFGFPPITRITLLLLLLLEGLGMGEIKA